MDGCSRRAQRAKPFRRADVIRLIKAAREAGLDINAVSVNPATGGIAVIARKGANNNDIGTSNSWDEVLNCASDKDWPA
jgi:hypothetical protein